MLELGLTMRFLLVALALSACQSSPSSHAPAPDALLYACDKEPADLAACTTTADCTTIALRCYCGAQPVDGVALRYASTAYACQDQIGPSCGLGCANEPGQVAQDGTMVPDGGVIDVRCDLGTCKTYVP